MLLSLRTTMQYPPAGHTHLPVSEKKKFPIQNVELHLHSAWPKLKLFTWNRLCLTESFILFYIGIFIDILHEQFGRVALMYLFSNVSFINQPPRNFIKFLIYGSFLRSP